jgi:hypothetical protein
MPKFNAAGEAVIQEVPSQQWQFTRSTISSSLAEIVLNVLVPCLLASVKLVLQRCGQLDREYYVRMKVRRLPPLF